MTKSEFKDKIKLLVKQVYNPISKVDLDVSGDANIELDMEKFPVLLKCLRRSRFFRHRLFPECPVFLECFEYPVFPG